MLFRDQLLEIRGGKTGSLFETLDEVAGVAETGHFGYLGNFVVGVFQQGHCVINANMVQIIIEINTGFFFEKKTKIRCVDIVLTAEILNGYIFHKIICHILHSQGADGAESAQVLLHHHQIQRQNIAEAVI